MSQEDIKILALVTTLSSERRYREYVVRLQEQILRTQEDLLATIARAQIAELGGALVCIHLADSNAFHQR